MHAMTPDTFAWTYLTLCLVIIAWDGIKILTGMDSQTDIYDDISSLL